jgi:6-phosphofructokinase 1
MSTKKILILTSGGDAPGMNAALRATVRAALAHNDQVYGCEYGFRGLIERNTIKLTTHSVANCIQRGGTILKSDRCETFKQTEVQQKCSQYLQQEGFDTLVVLGGNGSFQGALKLAQYNKLQVIGIPCTIDNDITGTDYCIGFDTACNTALQAIDRIRDTALSHDRHFIIEVMGRASGFLAVAVGIAGGAEAIVIPEYPVTTQEIISPIINNKRNKLTSIIVVAESDQPGHSMQMAKEIKALSGIQYKTCILGHTQRGGTPTLNDRLIASKMGFHAVKQIHSHTDHKMIALINHSVTAVRLPSEDQATKFFNNSSLLQMNQIICGLQ